MHTHLKRFIHLKPNYLIQDSKIFTSDLLDFSGPHSNLKYLSFVNCGNSNWCNIEILFISMDSSNTTRKKFQCSDLACKRHGEYFCRTHQMCTCKGCANNMHFKCELVIIQDLTDVNIYAVEVKRFVKRLSKLTAENGLGAYNSYIDDELKDFQDSLVEIEKKIHCINSIKSQSYIKKQIQFEQLCGVNINEFDSSISIRIRDAITHNHYEQFDTLQSQIKKIQIQMSDSNVLKDILYFSTLRDTSLYSLPKIDDYLSSPTKIKKKIDAVVKENAELMKKKLLSKSKQIEQQCKAELTEEFKDEINNLEDFKTQLEEDLKVKLEEIKESKLQHDKDQEEISKLCEEVKESQGQLEEITEALSNHLTDILFKSVLKFD